MAATAERRKGRHRPDIGSRDHVPAQTAHGRRTEPRIPDCRGGLRRSTTCRLQYHADRAAARRSGPSAPDARGRKERLHRGGETAFPARPDRPGCPADACFRYETGPRPDVRIATNPNAQGTRQPPSFGNEELAGPTTFLAERRDHETTSGIGRCLCKIPSAAFACTPALTPRSLRMLRMERRRRTRPPAALRRSPSRQRARQPARARTIGIAAKHVSDLFRYDRQKRASGVARFGRKQ
jgi:hypothetical protein